jgi:hypothetical protein
MKSIRAIWESEGRPKLPTGATAAVKETLENGDTINLSQLGAESAG